MKNQFADYETSKMLKELGFDEPCICLHDDFMDDVVSAGIMISTKRMLTVKYSELSNPKNVTIPMWQQIEQWLWEKHQILITVNHRGEGVFCPYISFTNKSEGRICIREDNPIDAKVKGIKEAVEYLYSLTAVAVTPINTNANGA